MFRQCPKVKFSGTVNASWLTGQGRCQPARMDARKMAIILARQTQ